MQAISPIEELLNKIKFIHDNYLFDISNSTNVPDIIKQFIQKNIKNFRLNINIHDFEINKKDMIEKYYKYTQSGVRSKQTTESKFSDELMTVAALILTCYSLNITKDDSKEVIVNEAQESKKKDSEEESWQMIDYILDDDVSNFILFYLDIYTTIDIYRKIGYDENQTCLKLKEDRFDGIRCKGSIRLFFERIKNLVSNMTTFSQAGGDKWKNKYLKYKKKYLNIKKIS